MSVGSDLVTKVCSVCGKDRPTRDYYRHQYAPDGLRYSCKDCWSKGRSWYYQQHRNIFNKSNRPTNSLEAQRAAHKKYRDSHTGAVKARGVVSKGIKNGVIKKMPCSFCGETSKVQAHHEDYNRPYDIIWLCTKHHAELHRFKKITGEQKHVS